MKYETVLFLRLVRRRMLTNPWHWMMFLLLAFCLSLSFSLLQAVDLFQTRHINRFQEFLPELYLQGGQKPGLAPHPGLVFHPEVLQMSTTLRLIDAQGDTFILPDVGLRAMNADRLAALLELDHISEHSVWINQAFIQLMTDQAEDLPAALTFMGKDRQSLTPHLLELPDERPWALISLEDAAALDNSPNIHAVENLTAMTIDTVRARFREQGTELIHWEEKVPFHQRMLVTGGRALIYLISGLMLLLACLIVASLQAETFSDMVMFFRLSTIYGCSPGQVWFRMIFLVLIYGAFLLVTTRLLHQFWFSWLTASAGTGPLSRFPLFWPLLSLQIWPKSGCEMQSIRSI